VEPTFYFLRQNLFATLGMIEITGHTELTGSYSWTAGAKFDTPVPEQTLLLDPAYGTNLPEQPSKRLRTATCSAVESSGRWSCCARPRAP